LSLPGPHGQVPCRLYLPDGVERPPLLVYAHGGGFMQGSIPSWDHFLRDLVRQSGVAALSVDYQLSPEVKFPVAYEEFLAMTRLAAREGAGCGIDPTRLAVGGDSAGATLAPALKAARVHCQLTVYQGINHGFIRYGKLIGTARRAIADCAAALKAGLA